MIVTIYFWAKYTLRNLNKQKEEQESEAEEENLEDQQNESSEEVISIENIIKEKSSMIKK